MNGVGGCARMWILDRVDGWAGPRECCWAVAFSFGYVVNPKETFLAHICLCTCV